MIVKHDYCVYAFAICPVTDQKNCRRYQYQFKYDSFEKPAGLGVNVGVLIEKLLDMFGYELMKKKTSQTKWNIFPENLLESTVLDRSRSQAEGDLFEIFKFSDKAHKWHHYFPIYTSRFKRFQDKPVRILEIGVQRGGSIEMWRKWFHPETVIVGLDINVECMQFDDPESLTHVRIGDQADTAFLRAVTDEFGPFDIIMDDGGHTTNQMITSFNALFRYALTDEGLYMVEDTHSNYLGKFIDSDVTFVDYAKNMVDLIHEHYVRAGSPKEFRTDLEESSLFEIEVPYLTAWVDSITFYDSIIAIEKKRRSLPSNECRYN
jgi:hypothetical protein